MYIDIVIKFFVGKEKRINYVTIFCTEKQAVSKNCLAPLQSLNIAHTIQQSVALKLKCAKHHCKLLTHVIQLHSTQGKKTLLMRVKGDMKTKENKITTGPSFW